VSYISREKSVINWKRHPVYSVVDTTVIPHSDANQHLTWRLVGVPSRCCIGGIDYSGCGVDSGPQLPQRLPTANPECKYPMYMEYKL
jgi:hypothetical protein